VRQISKRKTVQTRLVHVWMKTQILSVLAGISVSLAGYLGAGGMVGRAAAGAVSGRLSCSPAGLLR